MLLKIYEFCYFTRVSQVKTQNAIKPLKTLLLQHFNDFPKLTNYSRVRKLTKNGVINFVFLNLKLNGKKLEYTLGNPFDLLVNLEEFTSWRAGWDSNPR